MIGDERVINLQRAKVYVFSDSVLCLGKIHQHPNSNESWKERIEWITTSQSYRDYDGISGEPTDFEWNIFPGFHALQLDGKVTDLLSRLGETPENFTGRILFMSMFNDISCGSKDNEKECLANAKLVSLYARNLEKDDGHLLVLVLKRSFTVSVKTVHKEYGTILLKVCWWNSQKVDVQFSEPRAHRPEVSPRAKAAENCRHTTQPIWKRLRLFFRTIVSANQLSLYGAVAEICEEYETLHERTERPVVMGQSSSSLVLSVIKTEVLLDCDDPVNQDLLLQQYGERIEKLSQQDKLSIFCMDAGFLNVVEIGQYFRTKDTADLSRFHAVACREYTLPREEKASQPKGWIQGNTKNWKLQLVVCMVNTELRT